MLSLWHSVFCVRCKVTTCGQMSPMIWYIFGHIHLLVVNHGKWHETQFPGTSGKSSLVKYSRASRALLAVAPVKNLRFSAADPWDPLPLLDRSLGPVHHSLVFRRGGGLQELGKVSCWWCGRGCWWWKVWCLFDVLDYCFLKWFPSRSHQT